LLQLNLKFIQEIGDNDQEFISELISDFKTEIPNYLKEIEKSIAEKDLDKVVFLIHKLKSPINLFGIFQLEKEFNFIAENSKNISFENAELNASLNSIISTAKEALALVN
jgi:HPt (histidine-containing phosphotransfer) domain-containing protein